ncbi:MAG TPA: hypothetical protein VNJ01_13790 [Bacteriovoracaceae bacterium]|nr:hypothetical protein [Bacteriovoracaceae bacterium]
MFDRARIVVGVLVLLAIGYKGLIELADDKKVAEEISDEDFAPKKKRKVAKNSVAPKRAPASQSPSIPRYTSPNYQESSRNDDLFGQPSDGSESSNSVSAPGASEPAGGFSSDISDFSRPNSRRPSSASQASNNKSPGATAAVPNPGQVFAGGGVPFLPKPETPKEETIENPLTPVCSASIGGGSFSSPQNIELTCTTNSEILYCLSENTCCDPTVGLEYSAAVPIGSGPGTYCLSFVGTSVEGGKSSVVKEETYFFNPALPNLQMAQTKIYYQTTELEGKIIISSNDFGKNSYSMGVVNLKSHDPGTTGLNLDCAAIVEEHATLTAPVPMMAMPDTDVSGFSITSQIDVFFDLNNLFYGNNYLTSYMKNGQFNEAPYSCSTLLVTLKDFDYFQITPTHGDVGSNVVREFSGGFTHMGFFEAENDVYRGPAGSSAENVSDQELRVGMFGMFY